MIAENPELVEQILLSQIRTIEADLLSTYPNERLKDYLETRCDYEGGDEMRALLSFHPDIEDCKGCIDLIFSLVCGPEGTVFASQMAWTDGKIIDEVVVCSICSDCVDELGEKVARVVEGTRGPLVVRMVELLDNFYLN